jgi:hypothetical protein
LPEIVVFAVDASGAASRCCRSGSFSVPYRMYPRTHAGLLDADLLEGLLPYLVAAAVVGLASVVT